MSSSPHTSHDLIANLATTLKGLQTNTYPHVSGPESVKKRASVALVIRVQPTYSHWPSAETKPAQDIDSFFEQDWVKHGEPEVLFIKRAARKGDRWTSHVALPGGRRDPEDADDQAAAVRETMEEVGIDLSLHNALSVGNLPQRVVTTSWGTIPLMILCPYVFLITNPHIAPLRLQPSEVASTHWVPLGALLSADQRTVSYEDVSNRLANQETGLKRWMLRAMLGKMEFSALRLLPSESLHCTASPAEDAHQNALLKTPSLVTRILGRHRTLAPAPQYQPLILWGLTLGVMADFLVMLPPNNAMELWTYPTFTPWDVRLVIWAMTYKFKKQKVQEMMQIAREAEDEDEQSVDAVVDEDGIDAAQVPKKMHSSRYLTRNKNISSSQILEKETPAPMSGPKGKAKVETMIDGYYNLLRKAIATAVVGRTSILAIAFVLLIVKSRRRQQRQR